MRKPSKKSEWTCLVCHKLFFAYGEDRKYCSRACTYASRVGRTSRLPSKKKVLTCSQCNKEYIRYGVKNRPQLFCSRVCYLVSDHHKQIQREKMLARDLRGEKSYSWKGGKVSYKSIHHWVTLRLGAAKNYPCAHCCGSSGSKTMNWANLDMKYSRDLTTWLPLCKICHSRYDEDTFQLYSTAQKRRYNREQNSTR